jgi:hypothetical protein
VRQWRGRGQGERRREVQVLRDLHESGVDPDIVPQPLKHQKLLSVVKVLEYGLACMRRVVPYEDRQGGV